MSDETLASWADMYSLRRKVRCLPQVVISLNTPKVVPSCYFFNHPGLFTKFLYRRIGNCLLLMLVHYSGKVFQFSVMIVNTNICCHVADGPRVVQPWIQRLILLKGSEDFRGYTVEPESSAGKRVKIESESLQVSSEKSRNSVLPSRFLSAKSSYPQPAVPEPPGPRAASTPLLHNQPQSVVVPDGDVIIVPSLPKSTVSPVRMILSPNPMPMAQSNQLFFPHFNKMAQQRNIILNYECSYNSSIDRGAAWMAVCNGERSWIAIAIED